MNLEKPIGICNVAYGWDIHDLTYSINGLMGIEEKRSLKQAKPAKNAYENHALLAFPINLKWATNRMIGDQNLKNYINGTFLEYYAMTRLHEWDLYHLCFKMSHIFMLNGWYSSLKILAIATAITALFALTTIH